MRYEDVKQGYANLYAKMRVDQQQAVAAQNIAQSIADNARRYEMVAAMTGVPWFWIGITHHMESGCDFNTHLHNGDPLTARTTHEPIGHPRAGEPPFSWEESAADAINLKGLDDIKEWSLSRCLYEFERYNGFGYFSVGINSPYLWSFSDLYTSGKWYADHQYSPTVTSKQCGAAVILRAMESLHMIENWPGTARQSEPAKPKTTKIDQVLGGDWLAGKKTIIGIVAYVVAHLIDQAELFPLITNELVMSYFDTLITGWIGLSALSKAEKWLSIIQDTLGTKKNPT